MAEARRPGPRGAPQGLGRGWPGCAQRVLGPASRWGPTGWRAEPAPPSASFPGPRGAQRPTASGYRPTGTPVPPPPLLGLRLKPGVVSQMPLPGPLFSPLCSPRPPSKIRSGECAQKGPSAIVLTTRQDRAVPLPISSRPSLGEPCGFRRGRGTGLSVPCPGQGGAPAGPTPGPPRTTGFDCGAH